MYYVEDNDPILVKNEVILDEVRLKKLYQEIVARFGQYEHRSYDGISGPYQTPNPMSGEFRSIKNYTETPKKEAGSGGEENSATGGGLSHFEYDEYAVPELARAITRLLSGESGVIGELRQGPATVRRQSGSATGQRELQRQLQELLNSEPDSMDPEKFRQLTDRIKAYYREEGGQEREELSEYYEKVLSCITMKPVLTLYKDKLNELNRVWQDVRKFYEGTDQMEHLIKSMVFGAKDRIAGL